MILYFIFSYFTQFSCNSPITTVFYLVNRLYKKKNILHFTIHKIARNSFQSHTNKFHTQMQTLSTIPLSTNIIQNRTICSKIILLIIFTTPFHNLSLFLHIKSKDLHARKRNLPKDLAPEHSRR